MAFPAEQEIALPHSPIEGPTQHIRYFVDLVAPPGQPGDHLVDKRHGGREASKLNLHEDERAGPETSLSALEDFKFVALHVDLDELGLVNATGSQEAIDRCHRNQSRTAAFVNDAASVQEGGVDTDRPFTCFASQGKWQHGEVAVRPKACPQ